jgi:hypothetical protein
MNNTKSIRPLLQAMGIITAVMVLVSGVTFAALQSQQVVLKGNSIATAVAALKLSKDNITYASLLDGYSFGSLIPGGAPTPSNGNPIYLQNIGSTALAARISVDPGLTNPDNVDLTKVHIILSPFGGGAPQNVTLQELVSPSTTGGLALTIGGLNHINASGNGGFTMQVQLESDAVAGSSANIGNLTFNFNGLAVN